MLETAMPDLRGVVSWREWIVRRAVAGGATKKKDGSRTHQLSAL
jgi:hypothetical protein